MFKIIMTMSYFKYGHVIDASFLRDTEEDVVTKVLKVSKELKEINPTCKLQFQLFKQSGPNWLGAELSEELLNRLMQ